MSTRSSLWTVAGVVLLTLSFAPLAATDAWFGEMDAWDVVLLYTSVLAAVVLTTVAGRQTRSAGERTRRRRRVSFWLAFPSVALAVTGTLCWTLFIPILRTEVLFQYAVHVHERVWRTWSHAVLFHVILLPVAAIVTVLRLPVPTRGRALLFLAVRVTALWASLVAFSAMALSIDV